MRHESVVFPQPAADAVVLPGDRVLPIAAAPRLDATFEGAAETPLIDPAAVPPKRKRRTAAK